MNLLPAFAWPMSEAVVERFGWVLVHSLWQFALVALLAGVAVRALRRRSAATRYGVLVAALAVSVAGPVATWTLQPGNEPDPSASRITSAPGQDPRVATKAEPDMPPLAGKPSLAGDAAIAIATSDRSASRVASETLIEGTPPAPATIQLTRSLAKRAATVVRPWLAWIAAVWSLGVLACSLRPLLGWRMLRRLRRVGLSPASDEVLTALQRVSDRLGLRRAVRVLQSTLAQVPVVVGYMRPVILLPFSLVTCIPAAQLEAILAHELAHVRRHDFVINLLQTLVETIFFYHPAVWWLSRQIRVEREHCCDDLAVLLLGDRVEYGRALVAIELMRGQNTVLALGATDGPLLSRVRRILGADRNALSVVGRWPTALVSLALIAVTCALTITWALAANDEKNGGPALVVPAATGTEGQAKAVPRSDAGLDRGTRAEEKTEDILSRKVSLKVEAMPLKDALAAVARAAMVELHLDVDALKEVGLDIERPVTVTIKDEPLAEALGILINWAKHYGAFLDLRGGKLVITTLQARQAEIERHLPAWLKPHYNRGLVVTLDDDRNIVSIFAGEVMTDELFGKLKTLPKLRELNVETTKRLTPTGLDHLAELSSLRKFSLYQVSHDGKGLGDAAIQRILGLKLLRELSVGECGTTDAGVRLLEGMPQLTQLSLNGEGRLTDAALASIGTLKRLKMLSLSSYIATVQLGRMKFTAAGIRRLSGLHELEELYLVGHAVPADALVFPRLKSLSLGLEEIDDACADRIATLHDLKSLELVYTSITDEGLKKIAGLPKLSRLNLDSHVVTDTGIGHLKRLATLEHISLRASRLTDTSLRQLAEMKSLRGVALHGSGQPGANLGRCFTIEGVQRLKALPNLRTLSLTNFESARGFLGLKELTQLRELPMMMTNIRDDELDALEEALPNTMIHHATGGGSRLRKSK